MNSDNYLFYSSGCNFSLIPPKPKIPVLTVRREMYPFRFNDSATKNHCGMPLNLKHNERISLEVEIQFVRENDKTTLNTIRRRAIIDQRLTLADLPTQLLAELGCIIDPSLAQVEVFGLRLLDWSCLIPLDVVSEDLTSCTVGDKLSVLLNYLLFFFRVSIKGCHEVTSIEVWSIISDLVKRYSAQGVYHRLKQMNCPLLKTNSNAVYEFLFQGGSVNLDSLDQMFQLSFLDIFSFDNWYRSFPINQFLNGVKSMPNNLFTSNSTDANVDATAFEKLTSSLSDALRKKKSLELTVNDGIEKSCDSIIQEAIMKLKTEPHSYSSGPKQCNIDNKHQNNAGESFNSQKPSFDSGAGFQSNQLLTQEINQKQLVNELKLEKRKVRNRVTFVVDDLKQLEDWFKDNPRPSREKFQYYASELNKRHQNCHNKAKRTLHARNIVYWFKNARAAYKRLTGIGTGQDGQDLSRSDHESMSKVVAMDTISVDTEESNAIEEKIESGVCTQFDKQAPEKIPTEDSEESMENVFLQQESENYIDLKGSASTNSDLEAPEEDSTEKSQSHCGTVDIVITASTNTAPYQSGTNKPTVSSYKATKRRARIFLDPTSEVHRLEQWFQSEKYPDVIQIENFTTILNSSPYRQNHFRKLVPENVTLWFKNRRARLKRCSSATVMKTDPE